MSQFMARAKITRRIKNSLKTKVALAIAALLVVVLGAGAWINISFFTAEYLQWLEARSAVLGQPLIVRVKDVLSQVGYNPNVFIVLQGDVVALLKDNSEIAHIAMYDQTGKLVLHRRAKEEQKQEIHGVIQAHLAHHPKTVLTLALGGNYHFLHPVIHEKGTVYVSLVYRAEAVRRAQQRMTWAFCRPGVSFAGALGNRCLLYCSKVDLRTDLQSSVSCPNRFSRRSQSNRHGAG